MACNIRAQETSGQRALLLTTLMVPLAGWALHAATLHRRLAAAQRDPLTGAHRRSAFQRRAQRLVTRHQRGAVLCLVDLDHFKALNDRYGHVAGDIVLAATSERLARWAGAHGVVGRLGGDEFAVAARRHPDTVQELVRTLREPVLTDAGAIAVAASVGVAAPEHLCTQALPTLLRYADVAMYRAKHSGSAGMARPEDVELAPLNGRRMGCPGSQVEGSAA
ncbi:GGDEF domain-containing protein [Streptomyces sp. bgisy100]|uniref:GGDEF domain-containing protein n=1 Tax=Streptomyces sp. bgisy100 TaxID=3413783 RepID=UPI003D75D668